LFCDFQVREGLVYPLEGGALAEAGFAIKQHIQTEHGSSLEALLTIDPKVSGLTEIQRQVYLLLARGKGDQEVAQLTGKAASTIRNHRYNLRERGREAKVLAAIAQMLAPREKEDFVQYPESLTVRDERTIITTAEHDQVIAKFFGGKDGKRLTKFPKKEKQKLVILDALSRRFEQRVTYKESEINDILQESYDDYVTLRRYLIEYGFLNRDPGGIRYWRATPGFVPEQA
jgi:DNA-binding CsgD family transcriptional regulator